MGIAHSLLAISLSACQHETGSKHGISITVALVCKSQDFFHGKKSQDLSGLAYKCYSNESLMNDG